MMNRLQTWFITQLSCNLAWCIGFLVFSYLEEAYKYPSCFVINIEKVEKFLDKFLVKEIIFVSFHFTAFVNKFLFLSFAFIFSLLSLLSLFFLSLSRLPNTPLEDDNSRDAWLSLLPLKRKEASLAVGLKHVVLMY